MQDKSFKKLKKIREYLTINRDSIVPQNSPDQIFWLYSIPAYDNNTIPVKELGKNIKSAKTKVCPNNILVSKLNPRFPRVWKIDKCEPNSICSTEFIVLKFLNKKYERMIDFFTALFLSKNFKEYMTSNVTGTSSSHQRVQPADILEFEFYVENEDEMLKIGEILSKFEEKIALNFNIISDIEKIEMNLFKHWFVDFEFPNEKGKPYKSSGGKMIDSELGEIPNEWTIKNIKEILIFEKGIEPGSRSYLSEDISDAIRFIRVGDINATSKTLIYILNKDAETKICSEEDILLSLDATLGVVRVGMNGAFSSGIRRVYSKKIDIIPKSYIYCLLKSSYVQEVIRTYANGTTILHAGNSLDHIFLPIPEEKLFLIFSNITEPLFNRIIGSIKEIELLQFTYQSLISKFIN